MKNITKNILLIGNNNRVHGDLFHCLTGVQDADRGIFKAMLEENYDITAAKSGEQALNGEQLVGVMDGEDII